MAKKVQLLKKLNLLTYIDFELDGKHYRVARLKRQFCVYCDGIFVSKYRTVGAFETFLSKIFKLEINLVGKGPDEAMGYDNPIGIFIIIRSQ